MRTFTLGGIPFNTDVADVDGIFWYGYVDGWDQLDHRIEEMAQPTRHGEIVVSNLYAARRMTVFGTATGNTTDEEWAGYYTARDKLLANTNALTRFAVPQVTLIVQEDVNRQLTVVRSGVQIRCVGGVALQFEMNLVAEDPTKVVVA